MVTNNELGIKLWWQRLGCVRNPGAHTGEEQARDMEIAELRAELARRSTSGSDDWASSTSSGCMYPNCQTEAEQDRIAAEVHRQLYSGSDETQSVKVDERAGTNLGTLEFMANAQAWARAYTAHDMDEERRQWRIMVDDLNHAALAQQATMASASIDHDPAAAPGKADAANAGGLDGSLDKEWGEAWDIVVKALDGYTIDDGSRGQFNAAVNDVVMAFMARITPTTSATDAKPPAPASGSGDAGGKVAKLQRCGVCGAGQLYCNECGTGFASLSHAPRACQTPRAEAKSATSAADAKDAVPGLSEEVRDALIQKARNDWPAGFRDTPYKALDQLISAAIAASQKGGTQ